MERCPWAGEDKIYCDYHDNEWGVPVHDDRELFEMLCLECMQAGLSWRTILNKRGNFRKAFDNFDPKKISKYDEKKITELMGDVGIIRNRGKIEAIIHNSKMFLKIVKTYGSFDKYIWKFVNYKPIINSWEESKQIPARTEMSDLMSVQLKKEGFKFVGSTICYAFAQSVGLVWDHLVSCFCCLKPKQ
ncbi:DNA-3-methyladenine glycosylase I [Candidatus Dojkabacteria bacterium]|jgi:DNA-3-methyladenine glycosylase I|nr:DNA-3-methyladenine glycosylase I [Candidatus Dojkabacteria bacterium]